MTHQWIRLTLHQSNRKLSDGVPACCEIHESIIAHKRIHVNTYSSKNKKSQCFRKSVKVFLGVPQCENQYTPLQAFKYVAYREFRGLFLKSVQGGYADPIPHPMTTHPL